MKKAVLGVIVFTFGLSLAQKPEARLDMVIREDFFAGLGGDTSRFERAMKKCEEILAREPQNPSALVWHGSGLYARSGAAFRRGDSATGFEMYQRGLKEMADGVALEPESLQTRIPRGATLIGSAPYLDDATAIPLLELAVSDYEKALRLQQPHYDQLSVHSKGELMGGLADAYRRLGNTERSREYLDRLVRELPGSVYEKQAKRWLADLQAVGKKEGFCLGCHTRSR